MPLYACRREPGLNSCVPSSRSRGLSAPEAREVEKGKACVAIVADGIASGKPFVTRREPCGFRTSIESPTSALRANTGILVDINVIAQCPCRTKTGRPSFRRERQGSALPRVGANGASTSRFCVYADQQSRRLSFVLPCPN